MSRISHPEVHNLLVHIMIFFFPLSKQRLESYSDSIRFEVNKAVYGIILIKILKSPVDADSTYGASRSKG